MGSEIEFASLSVSGPAVSLFQQSYFELMRDALKPGGIVCSQAGTVWANIDIVAQTFQHCHLTFRKASFACAAVPTYPTGQIGFVLGSLSLVRWVSD
jgi:spermidine synthase